MNVHKFGVKPKATQPKRFIGGHCKVQNIHPEM